MSKSVNVAKYLYIVIFILYCYELNAQQKFRSDSATITILGTSNINVWSSETNQGIIEMSANIDSDLLKGISAIKVTILVETIRSPKGPVMDRNMHNALKADKHPEIVYTLEKLHNIQRSGKQYTLNSTGILNIAGIKRTIDLSISAYINSKKTISFSFSKMINMSDYNITPPSALFGLIRSGDEIQLLFNCKVERE